MLVFSTPETALLSHSGLKVITTLLQLSHTKGRQPVLGAFFEIFSRWVRVHWPLWIRSFLENLMTHANSG
jgi:hypothetical protein